MASGIIVILAALIPFFLNLISVSMTPVAKKEQTDENIEKAVVTGDVKFINTYLHDRVQDTSGSNTVRPSGKI